MNRPSAEYLYRITGAAEKWLRQCNDQPEDGYLVSAKDLRVVLATTSSDVRAGSNGVIVWTGPAGIFTAKPVRDDSEAPRVPEGKEVG